MQEIYTNTVNYEEFVVWLRNYFNSYWASRFRDYMQGKSTIGGIISSKTQNFLRVSFPTRPTALSVDEFVTTRESIKSQLQSFWRLQENLGKASQPKGALTDMASSSDNSTAELSLQTNPGVR